MAESLVSSEYDLLLDTALYVWEVARPALARVHSHEWAACRHLLANETGQQVRIVYGVSSGDLHTFISYISSEVLL